MVYVCLTFFDEDCPDRGTIQHIYSNKADAELWKSRNDGPYYEIHEWNVE